MAPRPDIVETAAPFVHVAKDVADAMAQNRPVVALESTIFSRLGLPAPHNRTALATCLAAIREQGAEPAMTAIIDGIVHVGVGPEHHDEILEATNKIAKRDIAAAIASRVGVGVTTVSATVTIAALVGIECFATGGIGGVHRNAAASGDISADLDAIAASPVVVVCSGAKSFLDLGLTLEYLETKSVPVLGWQTERFPAFTAADSGHKTPATVPDGRAVADLAQVHWRLSPGGIVVAVTPPRPIDEIQSNAAIETAERFADEAAITGPLRTPYVLEKMAELTAGATVDANIALAENNAHVAAQIARALLN